MNTFTYHNYKKIKKNVFDRSMTLFFVAPPLKNCNGNSLGGGHEMHGVGKICDFRQKSPFISETVRARSMATTDH